MKTLIVDDERVSRVKMQKIMTGFGECEAVESGGAALGAFKKAWENWCPFDLITLDIAMPDMDGMEVLYSIREIEKEKRIPKEKQTKILMVTSHSDKDTIITCIQAECDGYIVKPFERELIKAKIEKLKSGVRVQAADIDNIQTSSPTTGSADTKSTIIEEIIFRFKRGEIALPSLPQIGIKFRELVDRGATLNEIGEFLKQDVSISFKLIGVANSVACRGVVESKTVAQAINRLGLDTTRQFVNAISNRSLYSTTNKKFVTYIENLWHHSLSCAYASQILSEILKLKLSEEAFTMGLMHDVGKLLLLQIFGELEISGKLGNEMNRIEMFKDLDTHHGKFGSALLKRWKFSEMYGQIALFHDNLEEAKSVQAELLVIHFSNVLVKSIGYDIIPGTERDVEEAASFKLLKMDSGMIDAVKERVKGRMEETTGVLG